MKWWRCCSERCDMTSQVCYGSLQTVGSRVYIYRRRRVYAVGFSALLVVRAGSETCRPTDAVWKAPSRGRCFHGGGQKHQHALQPIVTAAVFRSVHVLYILLLGHTRRNSVVSFVTEIRLEPLTNISCFRCLCVFNLEIQGCSFSVSSFFCH